MKCKVCVVIVNYNNWWDTIACLESIFKSNYQHFYVIVVDNNSTNNSIEFIKKWANGDLDVWLNTEKILKEIIFPPVKKPIDFMLIDASNLNNFEFGDKQCRFFLISSNVNRGFAAGNNLGMKFALSYLDFDFVWLLNNDTIVHPDAMEGLINKAIEYKTWGKKIEIIGLKIYHHHSPNLIQSLGGRYNFLLVPRHYGENRVDDGSFDSDRVLEKVDYVIGASMFVAKDFIVDVGLMDEDYFLYYEEIDWTLRGKAKGWSIGYCWNAKIYHKGGGAIGKKGNFAIYFYNIRNRFLLIRKFKMGKFREILIHLSILYWVLKRIILLKNLRETLTVIKAYTMGVKDLKSFDKT